MAQIDRRGIAAESAVFDAREGGFSAAQGSTYALTILTLVNACNFVDRHILNIVSQPMKEELGLADWQVGLLGGLAFAIFYVLMGIPIARLAERKKRITIISILLVIWSAMTAVCGLAQNFIQMLFARVGVGIGEAGCSPASHSLIADYFPRHRRSTALSIFTIGIPLGTLIAGLAGSWVAQHFGWRAAFMVVGTPGLVLVLLVRLTLREPPRGRFDARPVAGEKPPSLKDVLVHLARKRTFIHITAGGAIATFASYAIATFSVPYLLRGFSLNVAQAGSTYALLSGISSIVGTALGGWLVDRYGARDRRFYVLIPAIGVFVSCPLYVAVLLQSNLAVMAVLVIAPAVIHFLYLGPTYGMTANMVEARMRATATAIILFILNLLGLGLGPLFAGILSDVFAARAFHGIGVYLTVCPGGRAPVGSDSATAIACRSASFDGLRRALLISSLFYLWAGVHYLLAAKTAVKDLAGSGA